MIVTYPFDDEDNYSFQQTLIQVLLSKTNLKLRDVAAAFTEDFSDSTGFVFSDATKAEISGGKLTQIDQRPADATFYASYSSSINGNWGDGVLTGTPVGGASISGGKLDLAHNDVRYVDHDADLNADSQQTGCFRFRVTPNYSGAPATNQVYMRIDEAAGNTDNGIIIFHTSLGELAFIIRNSGGGTIADQRTAWVPVAGTEYEIELNYDITGGANRIFVDGVQLGGTDTSSGVRDSSIGLLRVGSNVDGTVTSNFKIRNLLIFSTVQHTANYTPDWTSIPEYMYAFSYVTVPEFEHTGDGTIAAFNSFITVEAGTPRYTIQIGRSGNYLWWNGSAWVPSNNTYNQSNDEATFNANVGSLPVTGEKYGQFRVYLPDSNSAISDVDTLTANMVVEVYSTDNPALSPNKGFWMDALEGFSATIIKSGADEVKFVLRKDGVDYWHNGAAWATSNGKYAQANTAAEIETNKATFTTEGIYFFWFAILHSDTGETTPELDTLEITYNFYQGPEEVEKCVVYGTNYDAEGAANTNTFTIYLTHEIVKYKTRTTIRRKAVTITPNSEGYWEVDLVENENMEGDVQYVFKFSDSNVFYRTVPNVDSKEFWQLTA